jgi:hypothetical protein
MNVLSGFLLSHPRGAPHNEFPQFPQVLRQSRSPFSDHRGGGNNQAPKRGVLRFDPPGFEGLRAQDHNMSEGEIPIGPLRLYGSATSPVLAIRLASPVEESEIPAKSALNATRPPELPPVMSSIRLPCSLTRSGQHSSSVAMTWMAPRLVDSHRRFWSSDHASESARDSEAGIVGQPYVRCALRRHEAPHRPRSSCAAGRSR